MVNVEDLMQQNDFIFSASQCMALLPLLGVMALSLFNVLWMALQQKKSAYGVGLFSGFILTFLGGVAVFQAQSFNGVFFNGMLKLDPFFYFFAAFFCFLGAITAFCVLPYLNKNNLQYPEFYALLVFAVLGMMVMVAGMHLLVIFVALELMSISVYALVGFHRSHPLANEASLKYFILGSLASAVFLYGIALTYGALGSLNLTYFSVLLQSVKGEPLLMVGVLCMLVGFLFKIAAVPFHLWLPDVYEGAISPVTGFMAAAVKAAYFAVLMRLWSAFGFHMTASRFLSPLFFTAFQSFLAFTCILTLIVGNFIALKQTGLKRMLGFSAIAHTGYLLLGLYAGAYHDAGFAAMLGYLVTYAIVITGAFLILSSLEKQADQKINLDDFSGLAEKRPWLAAFLSLFLLSLAGIPPTAGFFAKYAVFYAALQAEAISLCVVAACCSVVSFAYYLKVLVHMYMLPVGNTASLFALKVNFFTKACIGGLGAFTLLWGFFPTPFFVFQQWVIHAFLAS